LAIKLEAAAAAALKAWGVPRSQQEPELELLFSPCPPLYLLLGGSPSDASGPEPPTERPR